MRKVTIAAAGAALLLAGAASAQQQPAPAPAEPAKPAAPSAQPNTPTIQTVNVVDLEQLPEATQDQVNKVVAERGDEGLKQLRSSIDARPDIKSALDEKGMTSAQVIAASLAQDGTLTLITKKKAS
jgi:Spy/CpxP family protein refolding chaperone